MKVKTIKKVVNSNEHILNTLMVQVEDRTPGTTAHAQSRGAFIGALATGRLSTEKGAPNYINDYMYMGRTNKDHFKHRETRKYLD